VVARETVTTIVVAVHSRNASIAAVDDLAERLEGDLQSLMRFDSINLGYILAGKTIDGAAFFDRMVDENWDEAAAVAGLPRQG
jgi:hypothetical protein